MCGTVCQSPLHHFLISYYWPSKVLKSFHKPSISSTLGALASASVPENFLRWWFKGDSLCLNHPRKTSGTCTQSTTSNKRGKIYTCFLPICRSIISGISFCPSCGTVHYKLIITLPLRHALLFSFKNLESRMNCMEKACQTAITHTGVEHSNQTEYSEFLSIFTS